MPLREEYPRIDDRRFRDLVDEARARVPRYTPEWTDLNENEPGMAVIELFAWLTELLTYRLGKVPKLNYLKFLELLGIELEPARPAQAEVTLAMRPGFPEPYVIVPPLTQLESEEPDDEGRSIVFETERSLVALAGSLDAVQTDSGVSIADVSPLNSGVVGGFEPFGSAARPGASVLFGFDSDREFPAVEVDLMVWVETRRAARPVAATCGAAVLAPVALRWQYWSGKEWQSLDLIADETRAFTSSGHVRLKAPGGDRMVRDTIGKVSGPRYWIRATFASGAYQYAPRLLAVRTNTVRVVQAETIEQEILGGSNGRPGQTFALAATPVLEGTLELVVDEGEGEVAWQEVADFFASSADDLHYVLNRTTGEVRFGNGRRGRIPVANARRPANIVARRYRVGGGAQGNVAANGISTLRGAVGGIDAASIANLFPAFGGSDEESLASARERVPQTIKSRERAVTAEDFELHAKAAGGIARAMALPLFHPEFPGTEVPGVVSVIVVPHPRDAGDKAPTPTEGTLRHVCRYLDARRLATVELYVLAPQYREVAVSAELVCRDDSDLAEVKEAALASLEEYFDPLRGGDDGNGWPLGGDIPYSLVLQRLLVAGVKRVAPLELELDGVPHSPCADVEVDAHALLRSGVHEIRVRYEGEVHA